ncbi:MAG TPA: phenylalanine--tRNA ligase subunit beta [Gemmatimonadales bacterium]|nr:phenylalanine--tRNA ligase subunit beta [Gemmatimonadales bacterium]
MNASRLWLEAFLRRPLEARDLSGRLAMLGVPCDAIEPLNPGLAEVVVGLVESVRPHPNADRLRLCVVNDGTAERLNVVCGAPNVTEGKRYPFARVGVTLPGGVTLERRKIRGEVSEGMLCSARELGLGQEHDGILELETGAAPGTPLTQVLAVGDERLVLDVTPNRPDLLGHRGLARELAYSYGVPLRLPEIPGAPADAVPALARVQGPRATVEGVTVGIEDGDGCRRFSAVVIRGVRIGPSPAWLAARLEAVGIRSISNVVDATNYVMLELNHPMHAYDLTRLEGATIVARRARSGERVVTLDGVDRALSRDMTVIADAARVIGVGGVMGAENTEVAETSTDLLLECAWFEPTRLRRTRRALGLSSDASYRFERGVDLWGIPEAQHRAASLILAVAGGRVAGGVDVWPEPTTPPRVFLRSRRVAQVLGAEPSRAEVERYLTAVGCTVLYKPDDDRYAVDVPGWRPDLIGEIDLIEEVARLHGYDRFPSELRPYQVGRLGDAPMDVAIREVREGLVQLGLCQAELLPLGPSEGEGSVKLLNPLSAEDAWLRQRLLPGLVRAVETNWSRRVRDVRLFEIGTVFRHASGGGRPVETMRVAAVLSGARHPGHWTDGERSPDFDLWDLKFLFEAAVGLANPGAVLQVHPNGWIATSSEGRTIGRAERLAVDLPAWAAPVFGFELDVSGAARLPRRYAPLATTPSAWRDVNLLLNTGTQVAEVIRVMRQTGGRLLEAVEVMSEFRAPALGEDRRAVQFRLTMRAADRTVRDEEVDALVGRLLKALERELDAKLRTS